MSKFSFGIIGGMVCAVWLLVFDDNFILDECACSWFFSCVMSFLLLFTDPQYCDADDGSNYAKTVIRRYRQSLDILKEAVAVFDQHNTSCNVLLGDTIDGK